jgi:hypothetical protein
MNEFSIKKERTYRFTITREGDGATHTVYREDFYKWNTTPNIEGFDEEKSPAAWANPSEWGKRHTRHSPNSSIFCNPSDWAGKIALHCVNTSNKEHLLCGARNPNKWVSRYITNDLIFNNDIPRSNAFAHHMSSNPGEWVKDFFDEYPYLIDWGELALNTSDWAEKLHRDNLNRVNWGKLLWSCAPWALELLRENMDRFDMSAFNVKPYLHTVNRIPFDTFMSGGDWRYPLEVLTD